MREFNGLGVTGESARGERLTGCGSRNHWSNTGGRGNLTSRYASCCGYSARLRKVESRCTLVSIHLPPTERFSQGRRPPFTSVVARCTHFERIDLTPICGNLLSTMLPFMPAKRRTFPSELQNINVMLEQLCTPLVFRSTSLLLADGPCRFARARLRLSLRGNQASALSLQIVSSFFGMTCRSD